MSKMRILLAAILCISLLTFAGCGGKNEADMNGENGTVTEDSTDTENSTKEEKNSDGSVIDDMEKGAKDAAEDLEKDARDAADGMKDAVDGKDKQNNAQESEGGR